MYPAHRRREELDCLLDHSQRILYVGMFIALALLVTYVLSSFFLVSNYLSAYSAVVGMLLGGLALAYPFAYFRYRGKRRQWSLAAMLAASIAVFVSWFTVAGLMWERPALQFLMSVAEGYAGYFFIALVPFMLVSLGVFCYRRRVFRGASWHMMLVFVAIAVVLLLFLMVGMAPGAPDDEEFIAMGSLHAMLSGQNPYAMSFITVGNVQELIANGSVTGTTPTSVNSLVGVLNYPALYPVAFMPAYLVEEYGGPALSPYYKTLTAGIYLLALMLALAFASDVRHLSRPNFIALAFIAFLLYLDASVVWLLMLTVMVIAYALMDSRYLFIALGIAASLQELLWIPVLLFLVYDFNNNGMRSGVMTLFGTLMVFLLVNGCFIAMSPTSFISNVILPVQGSILPFNSGIFAYPSVAMYQMPIRYYSVLFYCALAASGVLMAYWNDRRLLGLLSLLPFLFLYRSIPAYYTFFIGLFVLSLFISARRKKARRTLFGRISMGHARLATTIALAGIVAFSMVYLYVGHSAYVRAFDVRVVGATLAQGNAGATYSATLLYNVSGSREVYFVGFASGDVADMYGLFNSTILRSAIGSCGAYELNRNAMSLSGRGEARFSLTVNGTGVTEAACAIYDAGDYYICPSAGLK